MLFRSVSIAEQKEQKQCGFGDVFTLTIDFQCASKQIYEEVLKFLETWLATPCLAEVYTEVVDMNVEDNMHDEHVNGIFKYWSYEEIKYYFDLMLQQIDDEKRTTKDNMWQQPT